ncbi:zinc-ribbon domain-containing protein [Bacillus sp. 31A1R]|uniref:Zinc-ribbon domain-containing protein n=1 Tax=Robertmurraya mangrovi TaxID=3098077 RepID=A0ABU5J1Q1_9BACI|nr:zinc-ribbon domain-containing protein [Bacillus sp. 31A1R]MDZ5473275.1 zinc-ribbon domain-containing protein [Bacillus sp. 31A1R]
MRKTPKENSLAILKPEIAKQWCYEKNGDLTSFDVSPGQKVKVWWICANNEKHIYESSVSNRRSPEKGCPICSGKIITEENCLATDNPELAKQWNTERNGSLTPETIHAKSNKKVWWKCIEGHEWEASVNNRNGGNDVIKRACKKCRKKENFAEGKSLKEYCPEVLVEWDYDKNTVNPEDISASYWHKVWWKCKNGHEWKHEVRHRAQGKGKCQVCQSFGFLYPVLAADWHPEKNKDLTPFDVTPRSSKMVWFKCSRGHEYERTLSNHLVASVNCPKCNSATSFPEQAIFYYINKVFPSVINRHRFDFKSTNNVGVEADLFIPELNLAIEYDGWYAHTEAVERDEFKNEILLENGIQLIRIREKGLPKLKGKILKNINRNGRRENESIEDAIKKLLFTISDNFLVGNDEKKELIHSININIRKDRVQILEQFTFLEKENSIAITHPELAKDWDDKKNGELKPEHFSAGSGTEVWWKCKDCGHQWLKKISERAIDGVKCPPCKKNFISKRLSNKYLIENGSLANNHPELLKIWDFKKNVDVTPYEVTSKKRLKVWWKCDQDETHSYQQRIDHKVSGSGCIICAEAKRIETRRKNKLKNGKSLGHRFPEVAKFWHPEKNGQLTPFDVEARTAQVVWWKCENGHEWEQDVHSRSQTKNCSVCYNNKMI